MWLLEELTLLDPHELTSENWWEIARREYVLYAWMLQPGVKERTVPGLTKDTIASCENLAALCNFRIGRNCVCKRKKLHIGPHVGMKMELVQLPTQKDGRYRVKLDVKQTYPEPELTPVDDLPTFITPGIIF